MDEKELILRNTDEVVTEDELDEVLEMDDASAYVGYETSGPVHLGHWISARKLLDVEEAGIHPTLLWADRHTKINKKADHLEHEEDQEDWIQAMTDYWQATFEGLGLEDAEFVRGSEFQDEDLYESDLTRLEGNTTVNRAKHALGDVAKDSSPTVAQIRYPLMQALDIEYLDADLAIGGIDQRKIHMLAREELPKIGYDAPTSLHYPLLTSLKGEGEKMSSSKPATMFPLHADKETVYSRITDAYCTPNVEENIVDENPVLQIAKFFVFGADDELDIERPERYGGDLHYSDFGSLKDDFESGELHPADLKNGVADYVVDRLEPVRARFDPAHGGDPDLLEPLETASYDLPEYVE